MCENKVIVIPKKVAPTFDIATGLQIKKRVAAYARVSTDMDDQLNSLETQKAEYFQRINNNPDWDFAGLYYDEGITGTSLKKRDGFNKMIKDALEGKIDLILVKSISRFARNTVDCIKTKRQLEEKGVEIFFEKENISSLDSASETMLTIYASFAQEESRQISSNVKWGVRARMRNGTYRYGFKILGYINKGNNEFEIDPEGKDTVILIYQMFLNGHSYREIVNHLIKEQKKNAAGEVKWDISAIQRILTNEKYCGEFVYQKTFCKNYLTHERQINNGEEEQFLVPDHHEPIIAKDVFMFVQELRRHRLNSYNAVLDSKRNTPLAGLFVCADCGRVMQRVHYKSGNYERFVLTCKTQSRKRTKYTHCQSTSTIDYCVALGLVKKLVAEDLNESKESLLIESVQKAKAIKYFYDESKRIKSFISDLETKLSNLVESQIKKNSPIEIYQNEYRRIQKQISEAKQSLDDLTKKGLKAYENDNFNEELHRFLEKNDNLTPRLIASIIRRVYRLKDNTLLVVLNNGFMTEKEIDDIRKNEEKYSAIPINTFTNDYGTINYRVLERWKHE